VEYRPNTNTAIFEKQVTQRGGHTQEREGKGRKKVNMADVLSMQE
jgi:hypothetical protein